LSASLKRRALQRRQYLDAIEVDALAVVELQAHDVIVCLDDDRLGLGDLFIRIARVAIRAVLIMGFLLSRWLRIPLRTDVRFQSGRRIYNDLPGTYHSERRG
jgi:hypothetical protein